jgi:hypothetical protein
MHIWVDHAELKAEIQEEQSLGEYGGPQATSCVDTNLALDQGKPRASHQIFFDFSFNLYNCVMLVCALCL